MKLPSLRIALGLGLLSLSCGGNLASKPSNHAAPASESMASYSSDPREAISQLSEEIAQMRTSQGMPREPSAAPVRDAHDDPMPAVESTQVRSAGAAGSVCERTCKISAQICRNAKKICELADDLDDEWATEKCDSGKVSCKDAKQQCKDCDG